MKRKRKNMTGAQAAVETACAYSEILCLNPGPSAAAARQGLEAWQAEGRKNLLGTVPRKAVMQSGLGTAGCMHGALNAGALVSAFSGGQELLNFLPNLYKIAGEHLPGVVYAGTRTLAVHAQVQGSDASDVMACRQTGAAMLVESDAQEIADLAPVSHCAALEGGVPFLNVYDGTDAQRTLRTVETWDSEDLRSFLSPGVLESFRARALNPNHPVMRGSHENGDIFFQNREASNGAYEDLPGIVEKIFARLNRKTGTQYALFNYEGDPEAETVLVAMGLPAQAASAAVAESCAAGKAVGLVRVHLYRPFCTERFLAALPQTAKRVVVLEQTEEKGSLGGPLYLDTVAAVAGDRPGISVTECLCGLGSMPVYPEDLRRVLDAAEKGKPVKLLIPAVVPADEEEKDALPELQILEYGQARLADKLLPLWDPEKGFLRMHATGEDPRLGSVTETGIILSDRPVCRDELMRTAQTLFLCSPEILREYPALLRRLKPGGTLFVNADEERLASCVTPDQAKLLTERKIRVVRADASEMARSVGMGKDSGLVLEGLLAAELHRLFPDAWDFDRTGTLLLGSEPEESADLFRIRMQALDAGLQGARTVSVLAAGEAGEAISETPFAELLRKIRQKEGRNLAAEAFAPYADGTFPIGTSRRRAGIPSDTVPVWTSDKCLQCNNCAFSCPHGALRPFMVTPEEAAQAPAGAKIVRVKSGKGKGRYKYTMAVSPERCAGCGVCIGQCPCHALEMAPRASQAGQSEVFRYLLALPEKRDVVEATARFSQYGDPHFAFPPSCRGCGQTALVRLVAQLFGSRMVVACAPGCPVRWGGSLSAMPFARDAQGKGPAWASSLPEDAAEFGFGLCLGYAKRRGELRKAAEALLKKTGDAGLQEAIRQWLSTYGDGEANEEAAEGLLRKLETAGRSELTQRLLDGRDLLSKKSFWVIGGDGWAFDTGWGGLDHVLASGADINILILDNQMDSQDGGLLTKASPMGQSEDGRTMRTLPAKPLAQLAMTYDDVYVATVSQGADRGQLMKALTEAERHLGPSLLLAYCPCTLQGIKGGMQGSQREASLLEKTGHWPLFRRNPAAGAETLTWDSKPPEPGYGEIYRGEKRFSVSGENASGAEEIYRKAEETEKDRQEKIRRSGENG
jgi:pyruvate-ferredoxin/flavodoxin oxidoreductase